MGTSTRSQLIALAHSFFPAGVPKDSFDYYRSSQYAKFKEAWDKALSDERWHQFHSMMEHEFTHTLESSLSLSESARRLFIYGNHPEDGFQDVVVACVSVVAPFYLIYGAQHLFKNGHKAGWPHVRVLMDKLTPTMVPFAQAAAHHIEQIYSYRTFPSEYANIVVPDICVGGLTFGQVKLWNAFLVAEPELVP
jgi:hypothetical protein